MLRIKNETDRVQMYLYGTIGKDWWGKGNSAKDFAKNLDEYDGKPIDLHIDSGGGDVYEAFAMCAALQRYEGETVAYIEGLAASAASYIAVVCDKAYMNDYSFVMIHNAWTLAYGNSKELAIVIERLNAIDQTLADIYTKRTGLEKNSVLDFMNKETWFSAESALENGFVDEIIKTEEKMAASLDRSLAKRFKDVPPNIKIIDEKQSEKTIEEANLVDPIDKNTKTGSNREINQENNGQEPEVSGEQEQTAYCVIGGKAYQIKEKGE